MMLRPPYNQDVALPSDVNNAVPTDTSAFQIPVVDRPAGLVGMPYGAVQGPYQVVPVPVAATQNEGIEIQLLIGLATAFYFLMRG